MDKPKVRCSGARVSQEISRQSMLLSLQQLLLFMLLNVVQLKRLRMCFMIFLVAASKLEQYG